MNIADYIDQYMAGQLSESEKAKFEALLKENSDAMNVVKNYKAVNTLSEDILEQELLAQVKQKVYGNEVQKLKVSRGYNRKWLYMAAALLVLVIAYFIVQKSFNPAVDSEALYAFYERPIYEDKVRSTDVSTLDLFSQGKYYFELNDFVKSETTLRTFLETQPDFFKTAEANFWLAHALFQQGQQGQQEKYEEAGKLFLKSKYKNYECLFTLTQAFQSKAEISQVSTDCK